MIITATLLAFSLCSAGPQDDRDDRWSEDLMFLYEKIHEMHPDPFRGSPEEDFDALFDEIFGRIPDLTDDQMIVELMRFTALIASGGRDGHSAVSPVRIFHRLPVRFYRFEDGWFVIDAQDEDLIGMRLVALGKTPVEEACLRVRPLLNHDNDTDLLARYANLLAMPALTHALEMTAERERTKLQLASAEGEVREVVLDGLEPGEYVAWAGARPPVLPVRGDPLWLSNPGPDWWTRVLDDERALYVQYNVVARAASDQRSIGDFGAEIVRLFDEHSLERVVIDVRLNGGGDNTTFPPLIEALRRSERLNQRGRLYALIGRHTFSAAGNFVTVFERDLNSILVGEPTGGGPNQYGDSRNITLPNHPRLIARLSTRYHEFDPKHQDRLTHEPELAVAMRAADYFAGRDPVLRAALDHPTE